MKAKLATVLAGLLAVATLVAPAVSATTFQRDVFVRDNVGDIGNEPSAGSIYYSPDIKVCSTPVLCAVSQNPVVGVNNYVFVTLRRKPGAIGFVDGNLHLYRSNLGGGTAWPGGWTYIGTAGSSVPVGGTTVMITWPGWNVPGPAHFCLLARWVSNADPMTFAEGANTQLNAQRNNNIAWRNVDSVRVRPFAPVRVPYTIGNPERVDARQNLILEQHRPFDGTTTIDLGQELTARWKAAGGRAVGVKQVGETQFQIVDTKARFDGLVLKADERIETALTFATDKEAGPAELHVRQTDVQGTDLGGAQYLINEKD
ncbi:hypothetical protein SAMN04488564_10285 [Lentzea waywayandensis]|uniref:Uncharacterized protein n=1 Tax=Lentzea waywayandensis TaxID=84724 RepID=A0A1I6DA45_9PSEU|nr:hypothetical protein [Lentzea waywayandensis]SFR02304.1 hypothetical protein SAMN04488564_10285 [Lentzea waywayandensis]